MALDNASCTIFNRYDLSDGTIMYYATIIQNCHFIVDKAAAQAKTGLEDADELFVSFDYQTDSSGTVLVDGKPYLGAKSWSRLVNDDLPNYVTMREGNDIVMRGEWDGEQTISSSDYGRNGFYDWLRNSRDDVYLISSVGKYDLIPHFEIGGR